VNRSDSQRQLPCHCSVASIACHRSVSPRLCARSVSAGLYGRGVSGYRPTLTMLCTKSMPISSTRPSAMPVRLKASRSATRLHRRGGRPKLSTPDPGAPSGQRPAAGLRVVRGRGLWHASAAGSPRRLTPAGAPPGPWALRTGPASWPRSPSAGGPAPAPGRPSACGIACELYSCYGQGDGFPSRRSARRSRR
jgi:hypothetical protein